MEEKFCIIIPSHISVAHRLGYLKKCLVSLLNQDTKIHIYLSIFLSHLRMISSNSVSRKWYCNFRMKSWLFFVERPKHHNFYTSSWFIETTVINNFFSENMETYLKNIFYEVVLTWKSEYKREVISYYQTLINLCKLVYDVKFTV